MWWFIFACTRSVDPAPIDSDPIPETDWLQRHSDSATLDEGDRLEFPNGSVYDTTGDYRAIMAEPVSCFFTVATEPGRIDVLVVGMESKRYHTVGERFPVDVPLAMPTRVYNLDLYGDTELLLANGDTVGLLSLRDGTSTFTPARFDVRSVAWYGISIIVNGGFQYDAPGSVGGTDALQFQLVGDHFSGWNGRLFAIRDGERTVKEVDPDPFAWSAWYEVPRAAMPDAMVVYAFDVSGRYLTFLYASADPNHPLDLAVDVVDRRTSEAADPWYPRFAGEVKGIGCVEPE